MKKETIICDMCKSKVKQRKSVFDGDTGFHWLEINAVNTLAYHIEEELLLSYKKYYCEKCYDKACELLGLDGALMTELVGD